MPEHLSSPLQMSKIVQVLCSCYVPLRRLKRDARVEMIRKECASQLNTLRLTAELALKSMPSGLSRPGVRARVKYTELAGMQGDPY